MIDGWATGVRVLHGWAIDWRWLVPPGLLAAALLAALAVSALASWLGLGVDERLRDPDEARDLARAADCTFDAATVALDRAGLGALLMDAGGRVVLLRRHGARFLARPLLDHAGVQLERNFLRFALPEPGFEPITLDLGRDAQHWVAVLRGLDRVREPVR